MSRLTLKLIGTIVENKIRNRRAFRYQGRALPGAALSAAVRKQRTFSGSGLWAGVDHDGVYGGGTGKDGVGPCGVVYGQREGVFDAFCVLSGPSFTRRSGFPAVRRRRGYSEGGKLVTVGHSQLRSEALLASLRRCGFGRSGSGIVGRTTTSPTLRSLLGLVISANEAVGPIVLVVFLTRLFPVPPAALNIIVRLLAERHTQDKCERGNVSTRRKKEAGEYLALEMALAGYLVGGSDDDDGAKRPTERVRVEEERSSSSPLSSPSAPVGRGGLSFGVVCPPLPRGANPGQHLPRRRPAAAHRRRFSPAYVRLPPSRPLFPYRLHPRPIAPPPPPPPRAAASSPVVASAVGIGGEGGHGIQVVELKIILVVRVGIGMGERMGVLIAGISYSNATDLLNHVHGERKGQTTRSSWMQCSCLCLNPRSPDYLSRIGNDAAVPLHRPTALAQHGYPVIIALPLLRPVD
ncbi:hypothetical protein KC367_g4 [Hortaea werneckii]|nr:hypothetical protein KC367_g4 [Hortaea werneckii]